MKGRRKCIYLPERQVKWVGAMAKKINKSDSFIIQLAIEQMVRDITGGYRDDYE